MRRTVGGMAAVVGFTVVALLAGIAGAAEPAKVKPITAGPLTLNPRDIIAVYKPADGSSLGILVAKPGGAIQQIVLKDFREVTQTFNDIWNNTDVVKDPGDDDAKPLTRMLPKAKEGDDATKRVPILLLNVDRVLGIAWDSERRVAHIHIDRPAGAGGDETLEMTREEADGVVSAYKLCLVK